MKSSAVSVFPVASSAITCKVLLESDTVNSPKDQLSKFEDIEPIFTPLSSKDIDVTPTLSDEIRVKYSGTLLGESKVFDSNDDLTYPLGGFIAGWQIGFQELQEGDVATFYIPSVLGYGTRGQGPIPPNSVLVFDVELIEVK